MSLRRFMDHDEAVRFRHDFHVRPLFPLVMLKLFTIPEGTRGLNWGGPKRLWEMLFDSGIIALFYAASTGAAALMWAWGVHQGVINGQAPSLAFSALAAGLTFLLAFSTQMIHEKKLRDHVKGNLPVTPPFRPPSP